MRLVRLTPLVPHMMQREFQCQTCDRAKDGSGRNPSRFFARRGQEQLAAKQEQMAQNIATLQAAEQGAVAAGAV
jgi:hypothetical protein